MKIGILTFYCADNFGAMLQAYGLKSFVKSIHPETEIVPYAPFFLRGRYWLIPYYAVTPFKAAVSSALKGMRHNLRFADREYFRQKRKMRAFR